MIDYNNKILQLPFDEPDGSAVAYDYSQSRADGKVFGASFVAGKNGNAIKFGGGDTCEVEKAVLNIASSQWSILAWVQSIPVETGTPKQMTWMLNFGGQDYVEIPIDIEPGSWFSLSVVRTGTTYTFYVNSAVFKTVQHGGTPQGLSLNQDYFGGDYGFGMLDDVNVYNIALTQADIITELANTKSQRILLDGVDMREYGVFVSGSSGILNRPKMKTPTSISWDNYHGESVDNRHKYFEKRYITLDCFIKAQGKNDFIDKVTRFEHLFDVNGTFNRLVFDVHPIKPLIYIVYCQDEIDVDKTWNDDLMVGTFKLKLYEPEPVKRVLKHIRTSADNATCTIKMDTTKRVNIYWGDGTVDNDVAGFGIELSHTFAANGEYFPVITGCIDEISSFETNAIVVWQKL